MTKLFYKQLFSSCCAWVCLKSWAMSEYRIFLWNWRKLLPKTRSCYLRFMEKFV